MKNNPDAIQNNADAITGIAKASMFSRDAAAMLGFSKHVANA